MFFVFMVITVFDLMLQSNGGFKNLLGI